MPRLYSLRPWVRRFIPEALKIGLSADRFQGIVTAHFGRFYRHTDFHADWREMEGRERKRDPLKSIPKKYKPTADTIQPSEVAQKFKYQYNYKVKGWDTLEEKEIETFMTVGTDYTLTMQQAEEQMQVNRYVSTPDIEYIEWSIDSVTQRQA